MARGEQERSLDMVTGTVRVFFVNIYAFIYLGSTLSFVTPLVTKKYDVLPDVLIEPILICSRIGDSVTVKKVYRNCLVMLPNRVTLVDFI